jgi:hypothetical protein
MNKSALWYKKAFNNFHFTKVPESFFMNPSLKTTGLFLTPRGPYGRRLPERARKHMHGSDTVPLNGPDEKHKLWGNELQGLGAQTATSKFEGSGGVQRTMDRLGVPRDLSGQITPQRARGTYDTLAKIPPFASPSSQGPQPKRSPNASINPSSGGGGGYPSESTQTEPAERADGQIGKHLAVGVDYSKNFGAGERGEANLGVVFKSNPNIPFEPSDEKEGNDKFIKRAWGIIEK